MTITKVDAEDTFAGNGAATLFTTNFLVQDEDHLQVYVVVDSTGVKTLQVLNTDYSVDANTLNTEDGCDITYPVSGSPLATGETLLVRRVVPYKQLLDIQNQAGFNPASFEDQLDLIVMMIQQLGEFDERAVRFSIDQPPDIVVSENQEGYFYYNEATNTLEIREIGTSACPTIRTVAGTTDSPTTDDKGNFIEYNSATDVTITIGAEASVGWTVGTILTLIQNGAGKLLPVGGGGVTINKNSQVQASSFGQYTMINLVYQGSDTWLLEGNLLPV